MRSLASVALTFLCVTVLLAAGAARGEETKTDANLEFVQYQAPAGWQAIDRPGQAVRTFASPDSNLLKQAVIVIGVSPPRDGIDLRAVFDGAVKETMGKGKLVKSSDVAATKTRQGFDTFAQTLVNETDGKQLYARIIVAKVQNRVAAFYYLATSEQMFDLHQKEMDAMLRSVSFKTDGAGDNAAAKAELQSLEQQKQELLKKLAEIDARIQQLTAGPQAGPAVAVNDEQLLAKAKEQFAKEMPGRRKPHTILGHISCADGKPIPNVEIYRVEVYGTTIAAERTHYGLDVDANGKFEQQVPDGLYDVHAVCIVKNDGHRVPVDLVWLDDKRDGVVQASADGIVRDFCLASRGLRPGADPKGIDANFGGTLRVNGPLWEPRIGYFSTRHPNSKVQLTLTPKAPAVDGSRRAPIVINLDATELNYGAHPGGIPIGTYQVTVAIVNADGSRQQIPCARKFNEPHGPSVDICWECSTANQDDRTNPEIHVQD